MPDHSPSCWLMAFGSNTPPSQARLGHRRRCRPQRDAAVGAEQCLPSRPRRGPSHDGVDAEPARLGRTPQRTCWCDHGPRACCTRSPCRRSTRAPARRRPARRRPPAAPRRRGGASPPKAPTWLAFLVTRFVVPPAHGARATRARARRQAWPTHARWAPPPRRPRPCRDAHVDACLLPASTVTVTVSEAPAVCASSRLGVHVCSTSSHVPATASATAAPGRGWGWASGWRQGRVGLGLGVGVGERVGVGLGMG